MIIHVLVDLISGGCSRYIVEVQIKSQSQNLFVFLFIIPSKVQSLYFRMEAALYLKRQD